MTPQVIEFWTILQADFPWHRARLKFLCAFVLAILKVTTVNVSKLANALNGQAKPDSNSRRLQRFLAHFEVEDRQIARWILRVLPAPDSWIVSVDRTQWQCGRLPINILMAGIV